MSRKPTYRFRLYVAGDAPNSCQAVVNLSSLCKTHFGDRCAVEIVDVFDEPDRALADGILMTPTLIKLGPPPAPARIVGTLSHLDPVLRALGVHVH